MNFKTPLILLLLVVAGALVLVFTRGSGETAATTEEEATSPPSEMKPVFDSPPEPNDVVRVELERPNQPKLAFARSPKPDKPEELGDWQMTSPFETPAENGRVSGLAGLLRWLSSRASFKPGAGGGVTAASAGLEPPLGSLTVVTKQDQTYKLEVGGHAPLSTDSYVRIPGQDEIYVANRDLEPEIKREVKEYRSKQLLNPRVADVVKARIEYEGKVYELARDESKDWVIHQPVKAHADDAEVNRLLGNVSRVRVQEFLEDAPTSLEGLGLENPWLKVTLTTETRRELPPATPEETASEAQPGDEEAAPGEGAAEEGLPSTAPAQPRFETVTETNTLLVGAYSDMEKTQRYVKLPDQAWVASATKASVEALLPNLTKLRDTRITHVSSDDAVELEVVADDLSATLHKENDVWRGSGDLAELEPAAVADLLQAFEDVRAVDFLDDVTDFAQYGLEKPRAEIRVTPSGSVTPVTLLVGSETASSRNAYVKLADQPSVFVVSAQQAKNLVVSPLELRSRVIFDLSAPTVSSIEVQRSERTVRLARTGGSWKFTEPEGAKVDPAGIRELTNDLSRLRAKRVVAKGDFASYGLEPAALTIRFATQQPSPKPAATQPATQATTQSATAPTTQATTESAMVTAEHVLYVGRSGERSYARRGEDPYVFELDETVYRVLDGELIDRGLFTFKLDDIVGLKVTATGGTLDLAKVDDTWQYAPDPYVKLVQKKVKDFLKELAELRVERYLAYDNGDLAAAGLGDDAPAHVEIRLANGDEVQLNLNQLAAGELPRKAGWVGQKRIFILREADVQKLLRGVDDYAEEEKKPAAPAALPGPE